MFFSFALRVAFIVVFAGAAGANDLRTSNCWQGFDLPCTVTGRAEGAGTGEDSLPSVAVVHYRPPDVSIDSFEVGFVAAMALLDGLSFSVDWINLEDWQGQLPTDLNLQERFSRYALILVKSDWEWAVDEFVRAYLADVPVPKALAISGVRPPPSQEALHFYDVLFYETEWYKAHRPLVTSHPALFHAFGISSITVPFSPERRRKLSSGLRERRRETADEERPACDYIFVGRMVDAKRPLLLLNKAGRRLAIGNVAQDGSSEGIVKALREGGVEVREGQVSMTQLIDLMLQCGTLYLPCLEGGGGERAVLEARATGVPVEIEPDNANLRELLHSPVWDHWYYASQLHKGMAFLLRQSSQREPPASGTSRASQPTGPARQGAEPTPALKVILVFAPVTPPAGHAEQTPMRSALLDAVWAVLLERQGSGAVDFAAYNLWSLLPSPWQPTLPHADLRGGREGDGSNGHAGAQQMEPPSSFSAPSSSSPSPLVESAVALLGEADVVLLTGPRQGEGKEGLDELVSHALLQQSIPVLELGKVQQRGWSGGGGAGDEDQKSTASLLSVVAAVLGSKEGSGAKGSAQQSGDIISAPPLAIRFHTVGEVEQQPV